MLFDFVVRLDLLLSNNGWYPQFNAALCFSSTELSALEAIFLLHNFFEKYFFLCFSICSSFSRRLYTKMDERGHNFMCKRSLASLLILLCNQINQQLLYSFIKKLYLDDITWQLPVYFFYVICVTKLSNLLLFWSGELKNEWRSTTIKSHYFVIDYVINQKYI